MKNSKNSQLVLVSNVHAAELRATVEQAPSAPVLAGIQGAGGYGKTALLKEFAEIYRNAGMPVHGPEATAEQAADGAVLVDDAHRLGGQQLAHLRELAGQSGVRLIVAYRPGPRPAELSQVIEVLGAPVLLNALGTDDIAQTVQQALGGPAPAEWVSWLHAQTGGVPRFVQRVLAATEPGALATQLPAQALDQFQHDLEQLGPHGWECVLAIASGAVPHPELLAGVLDLDATDVADSLAALRSGGLMGSNDRLLPVVREAVFHLTPWERRLQVVRRLVETQMARGGRVLPLVLPLLGQEVALLPESTLATAFEQAGEEALRSAPEVARRLFDAAVSAGVPNSSVAARRAKAAAVSGELDDALRLADQVVVDESVPDRQLGAQVAASVLAHRGLLERSAEMCRWSVNNLRWSGDRAFAVVGLIGCGRLQEADELWQAPTDSGPPISISGAADELAEGVRESVVGSAASALSKLVRSASLAEPMGADVLLPDTPASVAALVALHCGEIEVAKSTLERAIASGSGGPLLQNRHRLLAAWLPLLRGDTLSARSMLESLPGSAVRDRLLATALQAGIANRDNDMTALAAARGVARQAVAEHAMDLFSLLPLGELVVAAARLRDQEWLSPHLDRARELLSKLGNPPLWSSLLIWKCLQAAVVLDEHDKVESYTAELVEMADHNQLASAFAEGAQIWLHLLKGQVDQAAAEKAARALHTAGFAWDGARLAGQAAIRTKDRRVMLALLECARALQGKPPRPRAVPETADSDADLLSEREKEVAELVLAGLTYKQVGKRLFISAKTVEHHIGRIKQRLGCANREELLSRLRELLGHH